MTEAENYIPIIFIWIGSIPAYKGFFLLALHKCIKHISEENYKLWDKHKRIVKDKSAQNADRNKQSIKNY